MKWNYEINVEALAHILQVYSATLLGFFFSLQGTRPKISTFFYLTRFQIQVGRKVALNFHNESR